MGKDYEILEEQYQKLAAEKAAAETRTDLTDDERANTVAGLDSALNSLEESIIGLANKAKDEIMAAIADLEDKIKTNEEFKEKAEKRKAELQAVIDEEIAKGEEGDKDKIRIYQAEIDGIDKDLKKIPSERTMKRKITEQKKRLLPLMTLFKDKGVFTQEEIDDLEKLEKRIDRAKKKKEEPVAEEPVVEEPVVEEPVAEEPVAEEPVAEEPVAEEPVVEEPVAEEPVAEEPVVPGRSTGIGGGTGTPGGTVGGGVSTGVATPSVDADKPKVTVREEWADLYRAAQGGVITDRDLDRLLEITSDPANFERIGITTGLFNNQAKVVYAAMGYQMTKGCAKAVGDCRKVFGISVESVSGDGVVPTDSLKGWSGIKRMAKNHDSMTASQAVFEKVIAAAEERGIDTLSEEEKAVYENAKKYAGNMQRFRTSMDAYTEIKNERNKSFMGRFFGKTKTPLLAPAEEIEEAPVTPSRGAVTDITDVIPPEILEAVPDIAPAIVPSKEKGRKAPGTEEKVETVIPTVTDGDLMTAAIIDEALDDHIEPKPTDFSAKLGESVESPDVVLETDVTEEVAGKSAPEPPTTDFSIGSDG